MPPVAAPLPPAADDGRQMAMAVYILYLIPIGLTHIIGLVLAYVSRETAADWLKSHYTFQIRTFWIGLLYFLVALLMCVILIGFALLPLVGVWLILRCAIGLTYWSRGQPYPRPQTWLA